MGIWESMSWGFDIATFLSVIVAAIAFIWQSYNGNKKKIDNERVKEISDVLTEYRKEHLFPFMDAVLITQDQKISVAAALTNMYNFFKVSLLPALATFSNKENLMDAKKMYEKTIELHNKGNEIFKTKEDKKAKDEIDKFNKLVNKYIQEMVELETKMTKRLRSLIHNETKSETEEIVDLYINALYKDR